jgi:hypothetical protein
MATTNACSVTLIRAALLLRLIVHLPGLDLHLPSL